MGCKNYNAVGGMKDARGREASGSRGRRPEQESERAMSKQTESGKMNRALSATPPAQGDHDD